MGDFGVCGEPIIWLGVDALAAGVEAAAGGVDVAPFSMPGTFLLCGMGVDKGVEWTCAAAGLD